MSLTFYHMTPGPFAERCLITLRVKRVAFEEVILDPAKGQNRTDTFLRLNPRGTLPVLQHDDLVVRESQAIMFYLDQAFPSPGLYGHTPAQSAAIMQAICDQGSYIEPLLKRVLGPALFGKGAISELVGTDEPLADEIQRLDRTLSGQPFLTGRQVSAADINIFPLLAATQMCLDRPETLGLADRTRRLFSDLPAVASWMDRMSALSGTA